MVQSIHASDIAFDFYRNWAGDFKRRQKHDLAIQHYELANQVKGDQGPARVKNIGDVYVTKARKLRRDAKERRSASIRLREAIARADVLNPEEAQTLRERQTILKEDSKRLRHEADLLEHEVAFGYYQEAVQRLEPYMTDQRKAASKARTDAGLYFDLASDELRANSRYRKLASARRNRSTYFKKASSVSQHTLSGSDADYATWQQARMEEADSLLKSADEAQENASQALSGAVSALEKAPP